MFLPRLSGRLGFECGSRLTGLCSPTSCKEKLYSSDENNKVFKKSTFGLECQQIHSVHLERCGDNGCVMGARAFE